MEIEKTAAMSVNSMGIGSLLSLVTFLPTYALAKKFESLEIVVKIVTILVNTPTEILSFGVGILTANGIGAEWIENFLSTDTMKNKQMVRLLIDRTLEQLNDHRKKFRKITEEEVYKIFHPKMALTYAFGKGIVKLMVWSAKKFSKIYCLLNGLPYEKTLFEQINFSNLALPFINGIFF